MIGARIVTQAPGAGVKIMLSTRYTLLSLCVLVAAPCMAQSSDPFRSAPAAAPDPFRSAPVAIPAKPVSRPVSPRAAREAEPTPEPARAAPADPELATWQAIAASKNAADFQTYLGRFPQGRFVDLAQKQIAALRPPPTGPFDGTWTGMWNGSGNRSTLVIKQIGPGEADVTYTLLAAAPNKYRGAITGNQLTWSNRGGAPFFSFTLNSDGSLTGRRSGSANSGSTSLITMQRQQ